MSRFTPIANEEPLLSGIQIGDHYQVHEGSVRRWRSEGMPCHRYNSKMVRYKLSEVDAWLKARTAVQPPVVVIPPHVRRAQAEAKKTQTVEDVEDSS
jgi:hypothetical protein